MTFDELRATRPDLGFAVYAYGPGGEVTLEVHADGGLFTFRGATLQEALDYAFPDEEEEPDEDVFG